jgi:ApaG protein
MKKNIETCITEGIKISVETFYQPDLSFPLQNEYLFAYRVTIENKTQETVQLLRRHWCIFDGNGEHREVMGEGVVGVQPILEAGERYQYVSGCNLHSELGTMHGSFIMRREADKYLFNVQIPRFQMIATARMN